MSIGTSKMTVILPTDVLNHIFEFCDGPTSKSFTCTCKDYNRLSRRTSNIPSTCAREGYLELLKWFRFLVRWDQSYSVVNNAGICGRIDVLEWLISRGYQWSSTALRHAAYHGHVSFIEHCVKRFERWNTRMLVPQLMVDAVRGHQLEVVVFLFELDSKTVLELNILDAVASFGTLDIFVFLRSRGCRWTSDTAEWAAASNNVDILRYCANGGCRLDNTIDRAALEGNIESVRYLYGIGQRLSPNICNSLFEDNTLDVLKFAIEQGYTCTPRTLRKCLSCETQNSRVLEYLIDEMGFELTSDMYIIAVRQDRPWALRFLHERGV